MYKFFLCITYSKIRINSTMVYVVLKHRKLGDINKTMVNHEMKEIVKIYLLCVKMRYKLFQK